MRKVLIAVAATLVAASPALANEGRVEARGGVNWQAGTSEATAGVAAGYDYDLGSQAFAGVEVSGDKILNSANNRMAFGFTGRVGAKVGDANKLFVAGGYTTKSCLTCTDGEHLGAGYEHSFGPLYGKVEYRHNFINGGAADSNTAMAGLGIKF